MRIIEEVIHLRMKALFLLIFTFIFVGLCDNFGQCQIDSVQINALLIDPSGFSDEFDTNADGLFNSDDEYIEICNTSSSDIDISNWMFGDDDLPPFPDYTVPDQTIIAAGSCLLFVNDYCPNLSNVCAAPEGILDMNLQQSSLLGNNGDVLLMSDGSGNSCTVVYGNASCIDVDVLNLPDFNIEHCDYWGSSVDGCPLLAVGDSCGYAPAVLSVSSLQLNVQYLSPQSIHLSTHIKDENYSTITFQWAQSLASKFEDVYQTNNSQTGYIEYLHDNSNFGVQYYRLKGQTDELDTHFSSIEVINLIEPFHAAFEPNISNGRYRLVSSLDLVDLSIINLGGQIIFEKQDLQNGDFVDLPTLPDGCYFALVKNGQSQLVFKFNKI